MGDVYTKKTMIRELEFTGINRMKCQGAHNNPKGINLEPKVMIEVEMVIEVWGFEATLGRRVGYVK